MYVGLFILSLWYMITIGDGNCNTQIILPDNVMQILAEDSCSVTIDDSVDIDYAYLYKEGKNLKKGKEKIIRKGNKIIVLSRIDERIINKEKENKIEINVYDKSEGKEEEENFIFSLGEFEIENIGDTTRISVPIELIDFFSDFFGIIMAEEDKDDIKMIDDFIESLKDVKGSFRLLYSKSKEETVEIYIK